ncbi:methyltransferase domain-containing protein [Azospirillum sp. Vi22]|nr:class I SAM-dependent methyltransferase [Azospirillum baldaniorum]NUB04617.1 methyltransferase domain-containing protein [Azospirillum baldaniorum]
MIPDTQPSSVTSTASTVATYDRRAQEFVAQYETIAFEELYANILDLMPSAPSAVLDVGAGSGRDAAWLAERGHSVIAVEPAAGMREEAVRRHREAGIQWMDDRLPGLERVHRTGMVFDLILLAAVWMHIPPADRRRAFRKLVTLLKPGGRMIVSLRHGPSDPERPMLPVSRAEIERLAAEHGAMVSRAIQTPDRLGRADVSWETVVVQLADDGTGALPLIRHIVLNDAKSSSYKLALLRVVARAADASPGLAMADGDDGVVLPLGLIALYWIRMFLPLVAADLPQTPTSRNGGGLGFVKEPFRRLSGTAPPELRVGAEFLGDAGQALAGATRDAARTIAEMPAHYITYPGSDRQVFDTVLRRGLRLGERLVLDAAYLWSVGDFRIPLNVWHALTRLNTWIEPALTMEWTRLMQQYLARQDRSVPEGQIAQALTWLEPERGTAEVRRLTAAMFEAGEPVFCVWTGRKLRQEGLDIDHCLPFSAWPNADLWNLMPADARVNRHKKADRLISAELLDRSADRIAGWWERAYLRGGDILARRFGREATASLPVEAILDAHIGPGQVLEGLAAKRLMLRSTQQLPEWNGNLSESSSPARQTPS